MALATGVDVATFCLRAPKTTSYKAAEYTFPSDLSLNRRGAWQRNESR